MSHLPLPSPLVSLEWLADHLGDQRLVVVDASTSATNPVTGMPMGAHDAYLITGHIPGAVYADTADSFREPGAPFPPARPGLERLEQVLRALGIDNTSTVVIYDSAFGQWAARVWWILRAAGLDRVALLNGGLSGWRQAGHPEERGDTEPRLAGELTLRERDGWWATTADVRRILDGAAGVSVEVAVNNDSEATLVCGLTASDPGGAQPHHETTLVCGLSGQAFAGNPGDPRSGHIPGSVNIPFESLLEVPSRHLLSGAALDRYPAAIDPRRPVITYCEHGILATGVAFALRLRGHRDVAVYDGSLAAWRANPLAPLTQLAANLPH
ncbi:MAG: hypothetical protein B5766_09350 [Candidatus Lumbricidophila eiseniae]|uniref:Rhodanese domain-containing protein n=1 Tax=Candidatus Lumbricidiphila eiseniae TaxID=1969409 RepID=A0A2A6FQB4_9MICO|nr:MAG: hypothetical protein B5766_09350 [Candidatus Lumbricidophila eiseniae]